MVLKKLSGLVALAGEEHEVTACSITEKVDLIALPVELEHSLSLPISLKPDQKPPQEVGVLVDRVGKLADLLEGISLALGIDVLG